MTSKEPHTIQERIQLEAYLLSERAGHPTGMDKFFWMQAEAMVHGRTAVVAPAGKTKAAKKPAAKRKPAAESKAKAITMAKPKAAAKRPQK